VIDAQTYLPLKRLQHNISSTTIAATILYTAGKLSMRSSQPWAFRRSRAWMKGGARKCT
jgi:hypothetical protein